MEANRHNNQQNVPQLGNHFEALEILQQWPEGTNVMLAPWIHMKYPKYVVHEGQLASSHPTYKLSKISFQC
jgi:hypothetical protein